MTQSDPGGHSELAALLASIEAENAAAHRALNDPAMVGRHAFITARMEKAQQSAATLIERIGTEQALPLIVMAMEGTESGATPC